MRLLLIVLFSFPANAYALDKIVVIDTGSNHRYGGKNCNENYNTTGENDNDELNHGTNVNFVLQKMKSDKYCIVNIKAFSNETGQIGGNFSAIFKALELVLRLKNVKYLNLSWSGSDYSYTEFNLIKKILAKNIKVFVAAGNEGKFLYIENCNFFPVCYRRFFKTNFFAVGGWTRDELVLKKSNYGTVIDRWAVGEHYNAVGKMIRGTSFASPQAIVNEIDNETPNR